MIRPEIDSRDCEVGDEVKPFGVLEWVAGVRAAVEPEAFVADGHHVVWV